MKNQQTAGQYKFLKDLLETRVHQFRIDERNIGDLTFCQTSWLIDQMKQRPFKKVRTKLPNRDNSIAKKYWHSPLTEFTAAMEIEALGKFIRESKAA